LLVFLLVSGAIENKNYRNIKLLCH